MAYGLKEDFQSSQYQSSKHDDAERNYQPPSVEDAEDCLFATAFHTSCKPLKSFRCLDCGTSFESNNALHRHLADKHGKRRKGKHNKTKEANKTTHTTKTARIKTDETGKVGTTDIVQLAGPWDRKPSRGLEPL
ncbi:hypothetical protein AAE478_003393 [Parahypoxylon ruwenzoriense]